MVLRLQILQAIQARLNTVINGVGGGSGGYYTNLQGKVFVFRQDAFQAHEMPGLNVTRSLNDFQSELVAPVASKHMQVLTVEIDLICEAGKLSHELADKIVADVYNAVGSDVTWGALADDTIPISDEIAVDRDTPDGKTTRIIGGGKITLAVFYRTGQFQES